MNNQIANVLSELADAIELGGAKGPDKFKISQYRKAASTLRSYSNDVSKMDKASLMGIDGIGNSISDKIIEFISTGKLKKLEELKKDLPPLGISEFCKLRKVGMVGAKKLWQSTGATNLVELIKLADDGKILDVQLLESIQFYKATSERILFTKALAITEPIFKILQALPYVERIEYGGSIRRAKDTVGDADILVLTKSPDTVSTEFIKLGDEIRNHGTTKSSIFKNGLQIDLTVITEEKEWSAAIMHATGSKEYNVKCRIIAKNKGWMLNDKGLFNEKGEQLDSGKTEEEICELLNIPFLIPELRELDATVNCGKINTVTSAFSDLHLHTVWSDGIDSIEDMVKMAEEIGFNVIAITDHGVGLKMNGVKPEKLADYLLEIERVKRLSKITVLKGIEANLTKEGELDYTTEQLKLFDFVVASIHSYFELSQEEQTKRLIHCIETYKPTTIGHPTCEDYGVRKAIDVDWEQVFVACVKNKVALELNAIDSRIGIASELLWKAKNMGVRFTLGSDSHSTLSLGTIHQSVLRAQRAGLTSDDLLWNAA
jgi:DNA polymerase (family 10)